ncbi:hypothetical protein FIBSPDRAFT_856478 [Athelia psychrophila]|uniref:Uncharacterized protein n=1 Tax=Athelia psychrophila TaxID=1759441 RepID=A0A166NJL9_9AGAM|nr:hypothetical protein FIBSPDRAFT_856478 [Fibularhizoctonia sp. CBS 109695]
MCAVVSIYERRDFKLEVGASISCAANGGQVCCIGFHPDFNATDARPHEARHA